MQIFYKSYMSKIRKRNDSMKNKSLNLIGLSMIKRNVVIIDTLI